MQAHINFPKNAMQSRSRLNSTIVFVLILLAGLAPISIAVQAPALPEEPAPASDVNAVSAASFPYVAEIVGDDVNIRSGPGTNYYSCGKLNKGDRVEVVSTQSGWSRIVPPTGTFSWISMQYVGINLDNPAMGVVTGDGVCVYAGSDYVEPMHSTAEQLRLHRSEKVRLLGEEKDDYCKIAPPTGAYLWVSSMYAKPVGPAGETPLISTTPPTPDTTPAIPRTISV